jgi:beta-galactosidase
MEAIAHGSEGALYFQIRQSRGASEKFHGAVIDHYGGKDTRVFKEVSETGEALKKIKELAGTIVNSKAAIIYDWDSQWQWKTVRDRETKGFTIWKR